VPEAGVASALCDVPGPRAGVLPGRATGIAREGAGPEGSRTRPGPRSSLYGAVIPARSALLVRLTMMRPAHPPVTFVGSGLRRMLTACGRLRHRVARASHLSNTR
jgi:hypothetical protein